MADSKPRISTFSKIIQEECWNKVQIQGNNLLTQAQVIPGRNPDRWRFDALGNPVCKKLNKCRGPLCFRYDFIKSVQDGGKNELSNCQILQIYAVILKYKKLQNKFQDFTSDELDIIEQGIYSDVQN